MNLKIFTVLIAVIAVNSIKLQVKSPAQLTQQLSSANAHLSPIGFRPLSGKLQGIVILAEPFNACQKIQNLHSTSEDIFVLADDSNCLESIKSINIANSGAFVAIIKENLDNTLHDKQINRVHIPVVELSAAVFDKISDFIKNNKDKPVSLIFDFSDDSQTHPVNVEVWISPTQPQSYTFLLDVKDFVQSQSEQVSFEPHYVLQSQLQSKNYIGCLSAGRYCPSEIEYEGRYQGKNVVEQILRQVILWDYNQEAWWSYISYFSKNCLSNPKLYLEPNTLYFCSENALIYSNVDLEDIHQQIRDSFLGEKVEVEDNTYLKEERQHYLRQQISTHPIILINKKQSALDSVSFKQKICRIQSANPSSVCQANSGEMKTHHVLIILGTIIICFIIVAALYRVYMYLRMKREIKSEVDKTLEQYYRYMETFEGQNGQIADLRQSKNKKQKHRVLNEQFEEKQIEMAEMEGK